MKNQIAIKILKDAINFHENKDYTHAERLYKKVLNSDKNNYDALRHLGILKLDNNFLEAAKVFFEKSINVNNKLPHAYNNLGQYHFLIGDFDTAIKNFNLCLNRDPAYWPAINNLAKLYVKLHDREKSLYFSELAYKGNPSDIDSKKAYGEALILNEKNIEGITLLKEIIKDHQDLGAYNILQGVYKNLGNFDLSLKMCKEALKINPLNPLSIYNISSFKSIDDDEVNFEDKVINQLKKININKKYDRNGVASIYFGLSRIFENKKKYSEAFHYLSEANKVLHNFYYRKINIEYDYLNKLKDIFNPEFIKSYSKFGSKSKRPIFIVGMPRSGTTLIEQILSSHSKIYGAGELDYLPRLLDINNYNEKNKAVERLSNIDEWFIEENISQISESYIKLIEVIDRSKDFTIDKLPHNFVMIGFIKILFPNSRIIYCKRDSMDNCFSLYKQFFNADHYFFYDQKSLGEYYKFHMDLMEFWRKDCKIDFYELDHEKLIDDPEEEIVNVLKYCELSWEDDCLNFHQNKRTVKTASNMQVRQPINKNSVMAWHKYKEELSILRETLELT